MNDIQLTFFDDNTEIYCYATIEAYEKHKEYMLEKRLASIEDETIIGNNEAIKVEYMKYATM